MVLDTRYIGPSKAARIAGCSAQWIRLLADAGKLPSIRSDLGRLVDLEAVKALAATRAEAAERKA